MKNAKQNFQSLFKTNPFLSAGENAAYVWEEQTAMLSICIYQQMPFILKLHS